jgi:hypothetical protein
MANILIVGFGVESKKLRDQIDTLMAQHGWANPGESATIILDIETKWCGNKEPAPYLVVQHSKAHMAEEIGLALHSALNLDTQVEVSYRYYASVHKLPKA